MRVLLIEDDKRLSALIVKTLTAEGFRVDASYNGDEGLEIALCGSHDLAIVDWMLPGRDGPAVCQAIRAARLPMGLLMLTARSQIEDRVSGLYSGADDYLTKPFAFDELIARLYALNRRIQGNVVDAFEVRVGRLVIDTRTHTARRAETSLRLTKTEWSLLECFMHHPGQTLSRQYLLNYVWSYTTGVQLSLVDVYVSYLRSKLKQSGLPDPIHTQRGFGYYLEAEDA